MSMFWRSLARRFSTSKVDASKSACKAANSLIPSWIEPHALIESKSAQNSILKNRRPFAINQLTVFAPDCKSLLIPHRRNPILKHLWKLRVNKRYKKTQDSRLVVGAWVVRHMLDHTPIKFNYILTTSREFVESCLTNRGRFDRIQLVDVGTLRFILRGTKTAAASEECLDAIAQVQLPPKPTSAADSIAPLADGQVAIADAQRLVLAFDNLKYSRNIGDCLRIAAAFGVDAIYLLKGTGDVFDWKTSCITGGIQYKFKYNSGDVEDFLEYCRQRKLQVLVAHVEGRVNVEDLAFDKRIYNGICLVICNESSGPSEGLLLDSRNKGDTTSVRLDIKSKIQTSLNVSVACAILLHKIGPFLR